MVISTMPSTASTTAIVAPPVHTPYVTPSGQMGEGRSIDAIAIDKGTPA